MATRPLRVCKSLLFPPWECLLIGTPYIPLSKDGKKRGRTIIKQHPNGEIDSIVLVDDHDINRSETTIPNTHWAIITQEIKGPAAKHS